MKSTAAKSLKVDGDMNRTIDEKSRTQKAEMMLTTHDDQERQRKHENPTLTKFSPSKTLRGPTKPMGSTVETAKVEVKEVQIKTLDKSITQLRQNISSFQKPHTPEREKSLMNQSLTSDKKQQPETCRSADVMSQSHTEVKVRPIVDILNEVVSNKVTA